MKKMKVMTILGTRPEIIRLSSVIKECDKQFEHILVHTGQNWDYTLNQVFFDELELRDIFGSVFCAPATPKNRSLVRFSINSEISIYDLNKILIACQDFYGSLNTTPKLKLVS